MNTSTNKTNEEHTYQWYKEMKTQKKERRAQHRSTSPALLSNAGLTFTRHNGGAHLVVSNGDPKVSVDFWPGTGLWKVRDTLNQQGRGVKPLIDWFLSQQKNKEKSQ